jgi:hypothetical protein
VASEGVTPFINALLVSFGGLAGLTVIYFLFMLRYAVKQYRLLRVIAQKLGVEEDEGFGELAEMLPFGGDRRRSRLPPTTGKRMALRGGRR